MSGFRGTLIFAVLVAAVAGVAVWQFKKAPPDDGGKLPGEVLFQQGKFGDTQELIFDGSTRKFKLKKEAGVWNIIEPFKDEADASEVNKSISDMFGLHATILDTGDGPIAWEKYGLTDPDETVTLKDAKDQTLQLRIGRVRTYDKGFYLRRGDEQKLIVASTTIMGIYNLTANSLRNKKMAMPGSKALGISVSSHLKGSEMQYSLKFEDGAWQVEGHKVKLSDKLITGMIAAIHDLRADTFAIDDKNSVDPIELKKHGVQNPVAEIKITFENPDGAGKPGDRSGGRSTVVRDIKFGQDAGKDANENDIYYVSDGNIAVYKTTKGTLASLLRPLDAVRDPKSPFMFEAQKVSRIKFVSPDFKTGLVLEKQKDKDGKGAWQIVAGAKKGEQKINEPVVMDFIGNIGALEAAEFFKPGAKTLKPEYTAELKDDAGRTLIHIEFGGIFKDAKNNENYLLKSSLVDALAAVRKTAIDKLTKPNLVQAASAPAQVTETKKVDQQPRSQ